MYVMHAIIYYMLRFHVFNIYNTNNVQGIPNQMLLPNQTNECKLEELNFLSFNRRSLLPLE